MHGRAMPKHRIALRRRIFLSEIAFFIVGLLYGSFDFFADNKKRPRVRSDQRPPSASVSPIQLNSLCELHFFPDNIGDHRHAILDFQLLNLSVSEFLAKTD